MELISLTGRLTATTKEQAALARRLLPEHIRLSRAEPGCLRFDLTETGDGVWHLDELFAGEAAFAAHQARNAASDWGRESGGLGRDFTRAKIVPQIGRERAGDEAAIAALLDHAFGGDGESRLVGMLREDGDLTVSLVARAQDAVIGHVALSPLGGDLDGALALAPVAVHPALHGRGLGGDLVRAALSEVAGRVVVVLGEPDYYGRFGFSAVPEWDSPYAGPYLQALGPDLPLRARITHAPAFARLG